MQIRNHAAGFNPFSPRLSWFTLVDALVRYEGIGYQSIEVPWAIPPNVVQMTAPEDAGILFAAHDLALVGSAEQSFLYLAREGIIRRGRYVAISPCFRLDHADHQHQNQFMKVELFATVGVDTDGVDQMITDARQVFTLLGARGHRMEVVRTEEGIDSRDILINGIEVGSYGIRKINGIEWVYGTGLAEPRFSQVTRGSSL